MESTYQITAVPAGRIHPIQFKTHDCCSGKLVRCGALDDDEDNQHLVVLQPPKRPLHLHSQRQRQGDLEQQAQPIARTCVCVTARAWGE